jgi:phage-related protein
VIPNCSELVWIGRSIRDFRDLPQRIQEELGQDLTDVRMGRMPSNAKPLKGFGGASVQELTNSDRAGTYRVVYTVRIRDVLCVLHAFQKKSGSGVKTSKQDMDIIKQRLAQAEGKYGQ